MKAAKANLTVRYTQVILPNMTNVEVEQTADNTAANTGGASSGGSGEGSAEGEEEPKQGML